MIYKEKILVVDDDRFNCALMRETCESIGYAVIEAHDGVEALQMVTRDHPDLVLLDIMMGGKDGFQVCQEIRGSPETADLPIIVVTALNDLDSKIRGLGLGANDYVTKPFHVLELQTRIRSVIDSSLYRRSLHAGGTGPGRDGGARNVRGVRGYQELPGDVEYELKRCERYRHPLSVVLLALDESEAFGSQEEGRFSPSPGGVALGVFQRRLRSVDLIYRIQEDQFVLLLPETPRPGAKVALERLRQELKKPLEPYHLPATFTAALVAAPHPQLQTAQVILETASSLLKEERWKGSDRLAEFGAEG